MNLAEIYTDNVFHYLMQFSAVNISAIFLPRFEILNHYTLGKKTSNEWPKARLLAQKACPLGLYPDPCRSARMPPRKVS